MEAWNLKTPRLSLRPFAESEAARLHAMSQEETLRLELTDQVYETVEDARETAVFLKDQAENGGWPFVLGVALKDTGELIGHAGLSAVDEGVEIGYAIAMAHQGKGYAAEAVAAFSAWAARRFSLPLIHGIVKADNPASARVLEKAGYVLAQERTMEAFGGTALCRRYLYTREGGA